MKHCLRKDLDDENLDFAIEKYIRVNLPLRKAHKYHALNDLTKYMGRIHPEIGKKITELAHGGITDPKQIRTYLINIAKNDICPKLRVPFDLDNQYFVPSVNRIRCRVVRIQKKLGTYKPKPILQKTHPEILGKVSELVECGYTTIKEVMPIMMNFCEKILCPKYGEVFSETNRYFYPAYDSVRSKIKTTKQKLGLIPKPTGKKSNEMKKVIKITKKHKSLTTLNNYSLDNEISLNEKEIYF